MAVSIKKNVKQRGIEEKIGYLKMQGLKFCV